MLKSLFCELRACGGAVCTSQASGMRCDQGQGTHLPQRAAPAPEPIYGLRASASFAKRHVVEERLRTGASQLSDRTGSVFSAGQATEARAGGVDGGQGLAVTGGALRACRGTAAPAGIRECARGPLRSGRRFRLRLRLARMAFGCGCVRYALAGRGSAQPACMRQERAREISEAMLLHTQHRDHECRGERGSEPGRAVSCGRTCARAVCTGSHGRAGCWVLAGEARGGETAHAPPGYERIAAMQV